MMEESAPFIASIYTWFTPTVLFIFLNLMIATILFTSNLPNKPQLNDQNAPTTQSDTVQAQPKLHGSPSSILYRLKSFTFHPPRSQLEQQPPLDLSATQYVFNNHPFTQEPDPQSDPTRFDSDPDGITTHSVENRNTHLESGSGFDEPDTRNEPGLDEENDEFESLDEVYSKIIGGNVNRTKSDTLPASGEVPVRLPAKMKKSASLKSAFGHFEEEKIVAARRPATARGRRRTAAEGDADVEVDAKADDFINKFKEQLKLQRLDSIMRYKDLVNRGGGK